MNKPMTPGESDSGYNEWYVQKVSATLRANSPTFSLDEVEIELDQILDEPSAGDSPRKSDGFRPR